MKGHRFSAVHHPTVGEVDAATSTARRRALLIAGAPPGEVLPGPVGAGDVRPLRTHDGADCFVARFNLPIIPTEPLVDCGYRSNRGYGRKTGQTTNLNLFELKRLPCGY